MPHRYWVVGGEYTDTEFKDVVGGGEEERHGPYETYEAARRAWSALSMKYVDSAFVKYRIEHGGSEEYWVVGGRYTDTTFSEIAGSEEEERIGPFPSYEDAKKAWQERAWATVDETTVRYRIEQR